MLILQLILHKANVTGVLQCLKHWRQTKVIPWQVSRTWCNTTENSDEMGVKFYFQGMPEKPCVGVVLLMLLMQSPVLWLSGLPLPTPPEDSLRVPLDGELLWPTAVETFSGTDTFLIRFAILTCLPSETKLAKTICKNIHHI